jgi:hypothetical protein
MPATSSHEISYPENKEKEKTKIDKTIPRTVDSVATGMLSRYNHH